jgi:hypothetical protein
MVNKVRGRKCGKESKILTLPRLHQSKFTRIKIDLYMMLT